MNQSASKELKKIIGYSKDLPEMRRHYKRLKNEYKKLSGPARIIFVDKLKKMYNNI
jgi:hypothetical protein